MIKRREFVKNASLATGSALVSPFMINFHKPVTKNDILKIGLVGCGGRGTGAAAQALMADENTHLVAMADVFEDQLLNSLNELKDIEGIGSRVKVPKENKYLGIDAYQKAIRQCDVVILATPPGFRPTHFEFAVEEGKHVFMEKPLSCDGPGTRRILEVGREASRKNLKVVVGLQNRYDPDYQEMVRQLQSGIIGDIVSSTCYYMKGSYMLVPRSAVSSELAYQIKNWHFFTWLWAGAPAGLQIHNSDIVHWAKASYPVSVQGIGGRISLDKPGTGDSYDHFYLEYTYEDGSRMHSEIRTIDQTYKKNGTWFTGTKGSANVREGILDHKGNVLWKNKSEGRDSKNPYQLEHNVFFDAIRRDTPHNDTEFGAFSTHAANMGRMAAESGAVVTWDEALNSQHHLAPEITSWDQEPPIMPNDEGYYQFPLQGENT